MAKKLSSNTEPRINFQPAWHQPNPVTSLQQYHHLYEESINQPDKFWGRQAEQYLSWQRPWHAVLHPTGP